MKAIDLFAVVVLLIIGTLLTFAFLGAVAG